MEIVSPSLAGITSSLSGLNPLIKIYRLSEWVKKQDPTAGCIRETHFWFKDTHRPEEKWWKKILHANGNQNRTRVALLIK